MDIVIKPLTEALIPDFLHFFDHIAFTDNPEWSDCYCYFFHDTTPPDQWMQRTAAANREAAVEHIKAGKLRGYLAYANDAEAAGSPGLHPVGWVNVNDKSALPRLATPDFQTPPEPGAAALRTGVIICFIIAESYRRKGIATRLLARIIEDYTQQGYDYLEAYPARGAKTPAHLYHGPMIIYQKTGFTLHHELNHYDLVRKKLRD